MPPGNSSDSRLRIPLLIIFSRGAPFDFSLSMRAFSMALKRLICSGERSGAMKGIIEPPPEDDEPLPPLVYRVSWFFGIALVSMIGVAAVAYALKALLV